MEASGMGELLTTLRAFDALRDSSDSDPDVITTRTVLCQEPAFAPDETVQALLPASFRATLEKAGISQLYSHQADAIAYALSGTDVVLESPTASGKTLSFNIPLLFRLARDPKAHALMLHPMKALSNDQRRHWSSWQRASPLMADKSIPGCTMEIPRRSTAL